MEQIDQYILKIGDLLGLEISEKTIINNNFFELIQKKNSNLYHHIKKLHSDYQSYLFIKKDKELRIKAKDIWESQKAYFKNEILLILEKINKEIRDLKPSVSINDLQKEIENSL